MNREMQFYENCTNKKNWWRLAPRIRKVAPGETKIPPGGICCTKSMKNIIFCDDEKDILGCLEHLVP